MNLNHINAWMLGCAVLLSMPSGQLAGEKGNGHGYYYPFHKPDHRVCVPELVNIEKPVYDEVCVPFCVQRCASCQAKHLGHGKSGACNSAPCPDCCTRYHRFLVRRFIDCGHEWACTLKQPCEHEDAKPAKKVKKITFSKVYRFDKGYVTKDGKVVLYETIPAPQEVPNPQGEMIPPGAVIPPAAPIPGNPQGGFIVPPGAEVIPAPGATQPSFQLIPPATGGQIIDPNEVVPPPPAPNSGGYPPLPLPGGF